MPVLGWGRGGGLPLQLSEGISWLAGWTLVGRERDIKGGCRPAWLKPAPAFPGQDREIPSPPSLLRVTSDSLILIPTGHRAGQGRGCRPPAW